MARIPETNKRFRTKAQLVHDLAFILKSEDLAYGTKYAVFKDVSWVWTEFEGKYDGCRRWSKAAKLMKESDPKTKLLRHEHAVPRNVVFKMLMKLKHPSEKSVRRICRKFLLGVVVTKEEDMELNRRFASTMPEDFGKTGSKDYRNPWSRYRECGIELVSPCEDPE